MAGFRTFATGEVLTAANVNNFLMSQSVMRFADADARTAALGTDVVEGMLTYNLATDQLEVFDGTNFVVAAPEPPAGIGSNVVQTVKTDTFTTTETSYTEVDGLTASITPTSETAKVLVVATITGGNSDVSGSAFHVRLMRGATPISIGDASGSRVQSSVSPNIRGLAFDAGQASATIVFLDEPATDSSTTYSLEIRTGSAGTVRVNSNSDDGNNFLRGRSVSSITLIEVAP